MQKFKCIEEKSGIELEVYSELCLKDGFSNVCFYINNDVVLSIPDYFSVFKENGYGIYKLIVADGYSVVKQEKESDKIYSLIKEKMKKQFNPDNLILESKEEKMKKEQSQIPPIKHKGIIDSLLEEIRINCELGNLKKVLNLSKQLEEENERLYLEWLKLPIIYEK